jgi:hypothetical protein
MKPDWDKLMGEFAEHASVVVADVDCTAAGKPLCDSNGVQGFPTIKYGDPANMETYEGGRDLKALTDFAKSLKPVCSPSNYDLCDDAEKAKIDGFMAMADADLALMITEGDAKGADAEKEFKDEVDKLQKRYKELQEEKEATLKEIKESGLGMLKAVQAAKKKAVKTEL